MYQQITLVGNLGNDPELRTTPNEIPVCNFSLAVHRQWTNRDGEQSEKTTWFRVTVWQRQAETVARYLRKGSRVLVVGEVEEANAYLNRDGEPAATLEVTGRMVKFLGGDNVQEEADSREEAPFAMAGAEIPF
jgi:single-strand DNA-binding protein